MENNFLNPQKEDDCGCNKNVSNRYSGSSISNENRLNERGYNKYKQKINGPDANMVWRNEITASSNKLNGPDGNTATAHSGNYRLLVKEFEDLPRVENGLLSFRNPEHFKAYYQYLEDMSNYHGTDATQLTQGDFYDSVERKIGFISLRRVTNEAFEKMSEKGWEKFEDIPDIHFIVDMLFRSFLSPNAEMKIGDYITRFVNKNVAVTASASNSQLLSMVRQLPYETTLRDVKKIETQYPRDFHVDSWSVQDMPLQYSDSAMPIQIDDPHQPLNGVRIRTTNPDDSFVTPRYDPNNRIKLGSGDKNPGNLTIDGWVPYVPAPHFNTDGLGTATDKPTAWETQIYNEVKVNQCTGVVDIYYVLQEHRRDSLIVEQYTWYNVGTAAYIIDWGDGRKSDMTISTLSSHKYDRPGAYRIIIYAYSAWAPSWAPLPPLVKTTPVGIFIGCGAGDSREEEKWAERSDHYRKIRGMHRIHQFTSWFGSVHTARAFARSEAYHWEKDFWGSWGWRQFDKNELYVFMRFDKYNKDDCHFEGDFPYDARHQGWEVEVQATQSTYFGWSYILSKHELFSYPNVRIEEFVTRRC